MELSLGIAERSAVPAAFHFNMTKRREISCIQKTDRPEFCERIARVGGLSPEGPWSLPEGEAINAILLGRQEFFVKVGGREVEIVIGHHEGRAYLKTSADQLVSRTLLFLVERA